jgi:hypothetical protein
MPQLAEANSNVVPITIRNITIEDGQLTAHGRIWNQSFRAPVNLSLAQSQSLQATCPILNLQLGPIDVDLLGLVVETSAICLDITAQEGGGLLGSLLCGIANLLNSGVSLEDILDDLSGAQRRQLTAGLTQLLNEVLSLITAAQAITAEPGTQPLQITCNLLNLALGPIDLNLLGLVIQLDNCNNGPATVDVTAEEGPGNLLGNLLCGLLGSLSGSGTAP